MKPSSSSSSRMSVPRTVYSSGFESPMPEHWSPEWTSSVNWRNIGRFRVEFTHEVIVDKATDNSALRLTVIDSGQKEIARATLTAEELNQRSKLSGIPMKSKVKLICSCLSRTDKTKLVRTFTEGTSTISSSLSSIIDSKASMMRDKQKEVYKLHLFQDYFGSDIEHIFHLSSLESEKPLSSAILTSLHTHTSSILSVEDEEYAAMLAAEEREESSIDGGSSFKTISEDEKRTTDDDPSPEYPDGHIVLEKAHNDGVNALKISHNGCVLFTGSSDKSIIKWDLQSGSMQVRWEEQHLRGVRCLALTTDDECLISGSDDSTIKLWDTHDGRCLGTLEGHKNIVYDVRLDCNKDGIVEESSLKLSKARRKSNARLVSGSTDSTVRIWSMKERQCLRILDGCTKSVLCVALLSHKGSIIIAGSMDKKLRQWRVSSAIRIDDCEKDSLIQPEWTLEGHSHWVRDLSVNCTQSWMASASKKEVIIWSMGDGHQISSMKCDALCVEFHPWNELWLAIGTRVSQKVRIVNVMSDVVLCEFDGHTDWIISLEFTPDGSRIVSVSNDKSVRVWQLDSELLTKKSEDEEEDEHSE